MVLSRPRPYLDFPTSAINHALLLLRMFFINQFQILNDPLLIGNKHQHQSSVVIEETVVEDATFPQQAFQEVIIKDGTVTHIGGGQYNGFIQGSCS